jgi:hypothetical protein
MLRIATGEVFEPKFQLGSEHGKPYRFHLHYLLPDERDRAIQIYSQYREGVNEGSLASIFKMGVLEIENFPIEVEGKTIECTTADEFLKYPTPHALYQEVVLEIISKTGFTEEERKN